ncbi:hypothetical protein [Aquipuribacter nitratireducens]|uniref:Flagellar protein FliT n=1 Tax=Aquipuribacter nitratireducens TaxID=650104 RepID=A0ABW0GPN5_9MICO
MTTRTATDVGHDFTAAWHAALDDLELEVDRAEALLHALHSPAGAADPVPPGGWTPPAIGAPLPESLRERAELLLERQLSVAGRLSTAMTASRKHQDVVGRLVEREPRPMYVDARL